MRTRIHWLSLLGIAAALFILWGIHHSSPSADSYGSVGLQELMADLPGTSVEASLPSDPSDVDQPSVDQPSVDQPSVDQPFPSLPVGPWLPVRFEAWEGFEQLTPRQQRDQLLDWALLAVLTDSGLDAAALTEVLYDLPPRRSGFLREIAYFEHGLTRSRHLGDGRVLALVPADSPTADRRDHLAHVADEQRKDLGQIPRSLWVFEYRLEPGSSEPLQVRRIEAIAGQDLFTAESGYTEVTFDEIEDLERFFEGADDVTYARLDDGRLRLGGRKILGHDYRGIGVEEVATLWQAEQRIQPTLPELEAFEEEWSRKRYVTAREKVALELLYERDWKALKQRLSEAQGSSHANPVRGAGFSLDWAPKYTELEEAYLEVIQPLLEEVWRQSPDDALQRAVRQATAPDDVEPLWPSPPVLKKVRTELSEGESSTYLALAYSLSQDPRIALLGALMEEAYNEHQFQHARYDGDLQGTVVGMVLFYTDLLAKLYALDFACETPRRAIPGFIPLTNVRQSPVFEEETIRHSSTRLWFGPLDEGFQPLDDNALAFGRRGTRVYAASSNTLRPGEESDPNAKSGAFLGWWNDHYDEVARYESEYQRLDQIMKWSTLISWLHSRKAGPSLGFLAQQPVRRDLWFPQWVQEHPELRFQRWETVGFEGPGYRDSDTEALPLLSSSRYPNCPGKVGDFSGGVSLAETKLFTARRALRSADLEASPFLRGAIDFASLKRASDGLQVKTLGGTKHSFAQLTRTEGVLVSTPRTGARLRTEAGELAHGAFQRRLQRGDGWLAVDVSAEGVPMGRFEAARTANGFRVGWASRELDAGQVLARRLSRTEDLSRGLRRDPAVDAAVQLPEGGFAVKLNDARDWLRLEPEGSGSVHINPGFQSRVAAPEGARHNLQLARIEAPKVAGLIEQGQVVRAGKALSPDGKLLDAAPIRGPPPAVAEVQRGDFRSAARRLATEPQAFRKVTNGYLDAQVGRIDRALAEGRPDLALDRIDRLSAQFGHRPALRLRRGLALLDQHRVREAAESVAFRARRPGATGGSGPDGPGFGNGGIGHGGPGKSSGTGGGDWRQDRGVLGFFDEVNRRIEDPQISPQLRDNTRRLAEYADFQLRRAHGAETAGDAGLHVAGDSLQLRIALPPSAQGKKLGPAELETLAKDSSRRESGVFYVQDSPSLAHLDWASSPVQSLHEISSGKALADVYRLPAGDVGRYNPAEIYAPAVSPTPLRRVDSGQPISSPWSLGARVRPPESSLTPRGCPDPEQGCQEEEAAEAYLVVPRPAA